jgi:CheY-like chemotaxis protein
MGKFAQLLHRIFSLQWKNTAKKESFTKKSVLLGEDNPLIIRAIKNLLEQHGYYVTAVEDGNKALNHLKNYTYDWGLLDLVLPEIDGIDLVKNYRSWEKQRNKPYILLFGLTAYPFKEIQCVCKQAGMDYVFEKPFTQDSLKLIETFLRNFNGI